MARQMATNLQQQGMRQEDMKLSPEMFRANAEDRVALGLVLAEVVRAHGLQAKPEQVKDLVQEAAQTYEQPEAVVRWHYEKPERLNEFEALAVERNVVAWVLGQAQVDGKDSELSRIDGTGAHLTAHLRKDAQQLVLWDSRTDINGVGRRRTGVCVVAARFASRRSPIRPPTVTRPPVSGRRCRMIGFRGTPHQARTLWTNPGA